jgi:GDP-mannose transporter
MTYTCNRALQYLSIPVYTIFKNLTIIVIAYGEVLLFSAHVSPTALFAFLLMALSSIVAAWADISHAAQSTYVRGLAPGIEDPVVIQGMRRLNVGYAWMGANVLCSAAYVLGMRKVIRSMGFRDWDSMSPSSYFLTFPPIYFKYGHVNLLIVNKIPWLTNLQAMYYNNLLPIPILFSLSLLLEPWTLPSLRTNFPSATLSIQLPAMIYSGLCALFISYASAWCIRITSSTTYSMVGALNKLHIAISGLLFFEREVTIGGIVAIFMGFGSGVVYAWAKNGERGKERVLERVEERDEIELETMEGRENEGLLSPLRKLSLKGRNGR